MSESAEEFAEEPGGLSRPVVKVRPGKGLRAGGLPWLFADAIAMDRRTKTLASGTLVRLAEGTERACLAAFNPESKIAARPLDPDPEAVVDTSWFAARIARALALRERLYDEPCYRLVHAEGDGLPGIVVDRFGDALVVQPNAAWAERLAEPLVDALVEVTGAGTVVLNGTARVRRLEGLAERLEVVRGRLDGPVPVTMNDATYFADLTGGQKTGLFYDQRPNHAFVARLARGARLLDLFTHAGGFALAALRAGAESALAVDSSAPALDLARRGAEASGVAQRFQARQADVFDVLRDIEDERFDVVISDPPAFAPSRQALANGLRAYERLARRAAERVAPGGFLVLCSCSHAVATDAFHRANATGIGKAGREGVLIHIGRAGPDHPAHPALPESYLKAMVYRLDG